MNDYYYHEIITKYIPIQERCILNKQTRYLMGIKKKKKLFNLYVNIIIHNGFPCFRYCVCHIAEHTDIMRYFYSLCNPLL